MNKQLISFVAIALVVGFFVGQIVHFGASQRVGSVVIHNVSESFDAGIDVNGTTAIDSSRGGSFVALTATGAVTLSGSTNCGTKSFAPGTLTGIAGASTTVSVPNAVAGNFVLVSFNSVTSTNLWNVEANVSGNGTTTVNFGLIASTTPVSLTTSTITACVIK